MDVVFSLGHSNRGGDAFVELLQRHHVEEVVDVRRYPVSRWPQFNQDELRHLLRQNDVGYVHLAALGARHDDGYTAWMQSEAWRQAYQQLVDLARRRPTAFMCTERQPQRCHRRYIARRLAMDGWRVVHLVDEGVAQPTLDGQPMPERF